MIRALHAKPANALSTESAFILEQLHTTASANQIRDIKMKPDLFHLGQKVSIKLDSAATAARIFQSTISGPHDGQRSIVPKISYLIKDDQLIMNVRDRMLIDELKKLSIYHHHPHSSSKTTLHQKDKFVIDLIQAAMADGSITHIKKSSRMFGSNKIEIDCKDASAASSLAKKMDDFATTNYNDMDNINESFSINTGSSAQTGKKIFFEIEGAQLIETYRQMIEKFNREHPRSAGRGRGGDDDFDYSIG